MSTDISQSFSQLSLSDEDSQLISDLYALSEKKPKLVKSSEYEAPADPNIRIRSWKMNEFKYYDIPSPFPTLARGLFTQEITTEGLEETKYRIVARGYDKFFNIGEVPWTTWASLEKHTEPPYTLTLKSNGCIIFFAALTPTQLLVTSKHSLGPIKGADGGSHAEVGERWLKKHLAAVGKTEEQLAKALWDNNWTGVAELCDDSFEEHVLPYSSDQTGLHLHGLNECTKEFKTMLPKVVDAFAREWGFIVTKSIVLQSIPDVKAFTDEIGKTGKWNGEALEGFVVRTHVARPPTKGDVSADASPYAPGSSFFFKVKFDEPYMMYRDWREVTKTLLSKGATRSNIPKSKQRRLETRVYAQWVIDEINRDRKPFAEYNKGKGIIATRERFLKWLETDEGKQALAEVMMPKNVEGLGKDIRGDAGADTIKARSTEKHFGKTIIVPIAIPGMGKTTIAIALSHLFGFGHTQSDDVKVKRAAPVFVQNVVKLLETHNVVIADKNNHLKQHRQQLRSATEKLTPPVRLMAFNWSFDVPRSVIHHICADRIESRGDNHQTLRADDQKSHEEILWRFIKTSEELQEGEVDISIEMDVEDDLDSALKRAIDACVDVLGVERPDAEQVGEALSLARGYKPDIVKAMAAKKERPPRYFALQPKVDLEEVVNKIMQDPTITASGQAFWKDLVKDHRVAQTPHVTIVHKADLSGDRDQIWERCMGLRAEKDQPTFSFRLDHLVWNDRIMAMAVSDLAVDTDDGLDTNSSARVKAIEFVATLSESFKKYLHVTVGTKTEEIKPVEARAMVEKWRSGDSEGIEAVKAEGVWVKGPLRGLMG